MSEGPYLFDVGVTALAHAKTPVSDAALDYVRRAINGEIDAVVPYVSLFGAHHVLVNYYGFSAANASRVLQNFMSATEIHWYDRAAEETVGSAFALASEANIDGWDGYYAQVAREEGVNTVVTLDADFERIDDVDAEIVLSAEQYARLNEFLE